MIGFFQSLSLFQYKKNVNSLNYVISMRLFILLLFKQTFFENSIFNDLKLKFVVMLQSFHCW